MNELDYIVQTIDNEYYESKIDALVILLVKNKIIDEKEYLKLMTEIFKKKGKNDKHNHARL